MRLDRRAHPQDAPELEIRDIPPYGNIGTPRRLQTSSGALASCTANRLLRVRACLGPDATFVRTFRREIARFDAQDSE
jgi:hypothetical protein